MKFLKQLWDFIGSMRFAVSMLTVLAIASAIGTLLKQNEPHINYTNQFGDFWAKIFVHIGLDDVYNQSWFLGLLVFLLLVIYWVLQNRVHWAGLNHPLSGLTSFLAAAL